MSYSGHCNRERIRIVLAEKPAGTVICHCSNCKRSGGAPCSVNYFVDEAGVKVEDPNGALKIFNNPEALSGNIARRHFCSNCGSPIMTITPSYPGKAFLKASLFDDIAPPSGQVFKQTQLPWVKIEQSS